MSNLPGYKTVDGVNYLLWGDSQYSYEPSETCPMPETEKLSHYLLDLFVALNAGGFDLIAFDPTHPNIDAEFLTESVRESDAVEAVSDVLASFDDRISQLVIDMDSVSASLATIDVSLGSLIDVSVNLGSLVEKITLLQVDISAVKLQIDKLYVDTIKVEADAGSSGIQEVLEKALIHKVGTYRYSILNTALLRDRVIPGDEELRQVGGMVSHIQAIENDLVSLEMTEPVVEINPGTLVYARSKIVREG
jgi:hypothetical protein